MKKVSSILWGVVLVAVGVVFALNAFGITDIDVFFDGWWTLFIIVPCVIGLFTESDKTGNIIGIVIGVFLLLCCQDILSFSMLWKLLIPAIIVVVGLKLILSGLFGNKATNIIKKLKQEGKKPKTECAIFSGSNINYGGEVFESADLTAVFGGINCDLRTAIIEKDCAIQATAVFGGIDILVPPGVTVKINSTSIFGGVTNKIKPTPNAPTLHVNCICLFGGVDTK